MMKRTSHILLAVLSLTACTTATVPADYTSYVDPKIGSGEHGHVFVGANVPFGMVQIGPTSIPQSWDWCSGYHVSDSTVIGFSHTHLSGTGIGDLFDVTLMPVIGEVTYARGTEEDPASGLWSYADRTREVARPGYYSVPLMRYGITAEMTASERTGFSRFTFPASDDAAIVIDLVNGGAWDALTEGHIEKDENGMITGWRFSKGWANDQKVYFALVLDKPYEMTVIDSGRFARLSFATADNEQVQVKTAISPVSVDGAVKNLTSEITDWNFEAVKAAASQKWNTELSKVRAESTDPAVMRTFYTALYHSMFVPALFSDFGETPEYTIFSLWDTYRAEMPLLSIIQRDRYADMVNTMLGICDRQGRLPVWHLWGCETDCMVGNPGTIVVADAIVKNVPGIDRERAYAAIKTTAAEQGRGGELREKYGFIPSDLFNESIAFDMEYAVADGAAAYAAKALGKEEDCAYFTERSHSYRHYFDPETGYMRGRLSDGTFRTPFNPFFSEHRQNDYCEGNAWQYTWLVPQDIEGLQQCFGSREATLAKLDSLFTASSVLEGENASPDISGMIGQYAHGNEPSHSTLYLYTMMGEPDKTADLVRQTLTTLYHDRPDGLSGNEDAGQMSAWYLLSAIGIYEAEAASGDYWFGSPLLDKVEIDVPGGVFTIIAEGNSTENTHIKSVTLNGEPYTLPYIPYASIMAGGELRFEMGI